MIEIPEDGWGADTPDISVALLGGTARPDAVFTIPDWAPAGEERASEPAADADSARERAGGVFRRQRSIGAFNRELDTLFASIAAAPDWSDGLERFDRKVEELHQRHAGDLNDAEDREAFARHAREFAAMQRIGLKRALVERQANDALTQLDDQLAYYAGKAAGTGHGAFRQIATESGLRAIEELRQAGYLTPDGAGTREVAFLGQVGGGLEATVAARAPEAAASPMESLAEWPSEGDTAPPDMAKELAILLGPALVAILAMPAGRAILQRFAPAVGRGMAKPSARPRNPRPAEEPSPQPPAPGASSPSQPRAKPPIVPPPEDKAEHVPAKAGREYASGDFATGQLRPADDLAEFIQRHVADQAKGTKIPVPTFELGELSDAAVELLRKHATGFDVVPGRLYVSGRSLKHTDEQRPDFLPNYADRLPDIVRNPDMILPNPTRPDPWERPWMYKKLDDGIAVVVEVRANGAGMDIVNFISPVGKNQPERAISRARSLGLAPDDLNVSR